MQQQSNQKSQKTKTKQEQEQEQKQKQKHRIIHDNLILYTHINCKDARDLDILVFVFGFFGFLVSFLCSWLWFLVWGFFRFFKFWGGLRWEFFDFDFWFCFWFFLFLFSFSFFVIFYLIVVAYCTQLLSQAMYNLMMAAMAEICSC